MRMNPQDDFKTSKINNLKSDSDSNASIDLNSNLIPNQQSTSTSASSSTWQAHCLICLENLDSNHKIHRALLPNCKHSEFCLECILKWSSIPIQIPRSNANSTLNNNHDSSRSRSCPLCKTEIGKFILYDVKSNQDYRKYWLRPPRPSDSDDHLNSRDPSSSSSSRINSYNRPPVISREGDSVNWGHNLPNEERRRRLQERKWEKSLQFRREVYTRGKFALHLGTNPRSRQRAIPTPEQFSNSPQEQRRASNFIRREFWSWPTEGLDSEWLTNYVLAIMKEIPLRSDSTVRLLSDFLGSNGSEHFVHEFYCFMRSPFGFEEGGKGLERYDDFVRYKPDSPSSLEFEERENFRNQVESESRDTSGSGSGSGNKERSATNKIKNSIKGKEKQTENEEFIENSDGKSIENQVLTGHRIQSETSSSSSSKINPTSENDTKNISNGISPIAEESVRSDLTFTSTSIPNKILDPQEHRSEVVNLREKLLSRLEEERRKFKEREGHEDEDEDEERFTASEGSKSPNGKGKERALDGGMMDSSQSASRLSRGEGAGREREGINICGVSLVEDSDERIFSGRAKLLAKLLAERKKLRESEMQD